MVKPNADIIVEYPHYQTEQDRADMKRKLHILSISLKNDSIDSEEKQKYNRQYESGIGKDSETLMSAVMYF